MIQPMTIELHLKTGHKRMFYQEQSDFVAKICDDVDGHIFSRTSLIIDGLDDVTAIPGDAILGITILTSPLPASFLAREAASKTIIAQISPALFQCRRLQHLAKVEGQRSPNLSEIEFISGEHLYLEFNEIAESVMDERNTLHHLFSRPSLSSRHQDGGFSIWNTAHVVSWSHYPKLEVPTNAWAATSMGKQADVAAEQIHLL